MATVVLPLCAPAQSWGRQSEHERRDTAPYPTKSGVIGMACAAVGIARTDTAQIGAVAAARMTVRVNAPGRIATEFQTIQDVPTLEGTKPRTAMTYREYLADACFTVFLEFDDDHTAEQVTAGLRDPYWPLSYGRKRWPIDAAFTPALRRTTGPDIDSVIAAWDRCELHPGEDTWTIVEETTAPLTTVGVEQYPDQPIDYGPDRRRTWRRTLTRVIDAATPVTKTPLTTIDYTTGLVEVRTERST
jgi:CRISPR-associated protein Cas5/CasD subtype I-E